MCWKMSRSCRKCIQRVLDNSFSSPHSWAQSSHRTYVSGTLSDIGNHTVKKVPPLSDFTETEPLCSSTILRTSVKPKPVPEALVVEKGLKIASSWSAGISLP